MKIILISSSIFVILFIITISQKVTSIGGILLLSALISTIIITLITNSWFAFILFLIYITGLLVIFGYFLSLRPNIIQTTKKCSKAYLIIIITILLTTKSKIFGLPSIKLDYDLDISSLINIQNISIYWFITIILLIILLIVVSLTFKSPTPLRKFIKW